MEMYTQFCMNLSSFGYVVVAIEHEDGSGSYAERAPQVEGKEGVFDIPAQGREPILFTPPPTKVEGSNRDAIIAFRGPHLAQRLEELRTTLESIKAAGNQVASNVSHVVEMYAPAPAATQPHDATALLPIIQNCETSRISLVGHSFGAATVFLAGAPSAALPTGPPAAIAVLDPWAECMSDEQLNEEKTPPMLSIHSESWKELALKSSCAHAFMNSLSELRAPLVLRKTVHQSFSDVMNWVPAMVSRRIHALGPEEVLHVTHRASAEACAVHIAQARHGAPTTAEDTHWHERLPTAGKDFESLRKQHVVNH